MIRTLKLTPRWTPLKAHHRQELFFWHPAPIKVNPSGRRSGKTELVKRKAVLKLRKKLAWPGRYFLGAPTNDQAHDIFWEDIKALTPKSWVAKYNESRMELHTNWGAMIRVAGLDRPQRLEGVPWDWGGIDELADCPAGLLNRNLLPAMSTIGRTISLDLIGVPDEVGPNQAEYETFWQTGLSWPNADPNICSFHWPSDTIIEPEKIAQLRATMDSFAFEQEMGGKFLRSGGKALPAFDPVVHVSEYFAEYSDRLPLDWALDFGVGENAVGLIGQTYMGRMWIMDEIICKGGSTDVQVDAFKDRCIERGYRTRNVRLFGDAAGHGRNTATGETDYQIIEKMTRGMYLERLDLTAAPLIKDTINVLRARTKTADGQVHLHIHPRCKTLIEHCKTAPWPDKLTAFHCLAALRYYAYGLFGDDMGGPAISVARRELPARR